MRSIAGDKRVLFVSHTAEMGGAELFLVDVVRGGPPAWSACFLSDGPAAAALRRSGREVLVLSASQTMLSIRRGSGLLAALNGCAGVVTTARALAKIAAGFDVLVANSQKSLPVCALAAALARRPMVWGLHDILTDPAYSAINRRAAVWIANRRARAVLVNSEATLRGFVDAGGRRDLACVAPNGFDPADHPPGDEAARRRLRAEFRFDGRPVAGIFGRLSPWKGQSVFLEALAQAPELQGLVVGGAIFEDDSFEPRLREQARALRLEDRVRFTGFRDDVARLMAGVDMVVHASTSPEPFGRVIVEGMLARRLVIAADGGGVRSIVTDGRNGILVEPGDAGKLARALRQGAAAPDGAARMAAQAREDACRRFSLATTIGVVARTIAAAA